MRRVWPNSSICTRPSHTWLHTPYIPQQWRKKALSVGVNEARAYSRQDLGPDWVAKNHEILSQRRGAGWWLWKPYLILRTLNDRSIPWYTGVVMWVDAGNYLHADPRPLVTK